MTSCSDTISIGAPKAAEVQRLQEQLIGLGCWPEGQPPEREFTKNFEAAVTKFQISRGFETIDGIASPTIRASLQSEVADLQFAIQSIDKSYAPLRRGRFDKNLVDALKRLQSANRLPETGKLDPETLSIVREKRGPIFFNQQLANELDVILSLRDENRDHSSDELATDTAQRARLFGLAFSGGGIRSATFNLGIIQSLAAVGLLNMVDYLSTVSGGGYVGSWLSAWISRRGGDRASIAEELRRQLKASSNEAKPRHQEARQIQWLRRFSNYITPRTGVLGIDFLQAVVTWVRNVLLNQYILVAFICFLLLVPWGLALAVSWLGRELGADYWLLSTGVLALGATSLATLTLGFRSARISAGERPYRQNVGYEIGYAYCLSALFSGIGLIGSAIPRDLALPIALAGFVVYVFSWTIGWFLSFLLSADGLAFGKCRRVHVAAARGSLAAGVVLGLALFVLVTFTASMSGPHVDAQRVLLATVLGPTIATVAILVALTAHIGFAGRGLGEPLREWWSRMGAVIVRANLFWLALAGTALYGPFGVLYADKWAAAGGLAWLATTIGGAFAGASVRTGDRKGKGKLDLLARFAPYVFCIGLMIFISFYFYRAVDANWNSDGSATHECVIDENRNAATNSTAGRGAAQQLCSFDAYSEHVRDLLGEMEKSAGGFFSVKWLPGLAFFISAILLAWTADVNVFSLHMFYRNRLERCYLGASNKNRREDDFTGLDTRDSPRLSSLVQRPLPIINTALNITQTGNLAWQERKGASFTFTPLYCGFQFENEMGVDEPAYQPTRDYVSSEKSPGWIALIMPVTISGAAASPNWGYHTNPATSFLMTMFNIRLGWWMQNPLKGEFWRRAGPKWASRSLLNELTGSTTSEKGFVYLSDGGHFENLGLYELVRRRCRYIVVCDAGCDPLFQFEDLGNAIRKIRIDMGIDIDIDVRPLVPDPQTGKSQFHCAIGRVNYQCADRGYLLYIKPTLRGHEPTDVRQYRDLHLTFPHETTGDQWFGESQFESYRQLGRHIAKMVVEESAAIAERDDAVEGRCDLELFFRNLSERWFAPSSVGQSFSRHGDTVTRIFERLRSDQNLKFMDAQIYPEWPYMSDSVSDRPQPKMKLPDSYSELRAGFYLCNQMIQLMENVYHDLDLEADYEHPDNRGWINLFRHWSWSGMFRAVWAVSASSYGARFQTFCRERLDLRTATEIDCSNAYKFDNACLALQVGEAYVQGALLNFLERSSLSKLWAYYGQSGRDADMRAVPLRLRVLDPIALERSGEEKQNAPSSLFEFTFGVAVIDGYGGKEPSLLYFRVQDHLRATGLGTKALRKLQDHCHGLVLGELDEGLHLGPSEEDRIRLTLLAESVGIQRQKCGELISDTKEARSEVRVSQREELAMPEGAAAH